MRPWSGRVGVPRRRGTRELTFSLSLPQEGTARRQPPTSQEDSSRQKLPGWPDRLFGLFHKMAHKQHLVVFNFIQNNFVRLYPESCHITCLFKKLFKIGEFLYSHFNIKVEESKATFSAHYALSFQERWKHNKKRFRRGMEKGYDWSNVSKVFAEFCAGDFSLDDAQYISLILDFPACKPMRNRCLLFKPPSL